MCVCVCVCAAISRCTFLSVFAVYLLVSYMCAKIRVWSCLVTGSFGLFTEIPVCKSSCMAVGGCELTFFIIIFYILSIVCVCTFFCRFLYGALCPRSC